MSNTHRSGVRHFDKAARRPACNGGTTANYRDTLDIEEAAHAINSINSRIKREKHEASKAERAKVSLAGGDALAAWLRKDVP